MYLHDLLGESNKKTVPKQIDMSDRDVLRREFLGALGTTAAVGLAGCSGGDDDSRNTTGTGSGTEKSGQNSQTSDEASTDGGEVSPDGQQSPTQSQQNSDLGAGEYPESESDGLEARTEEHWENSGLDFFGLEISNYDFLDMSDSSNLEERREATYSIQEAMTLAAGNSSESVYMVVPDLDNPDVYNLGSIRFFSDGIDDDPVIGGAVAEPDPKDEARESYVEFFRDHVNPEGRSKSVFAEEAVVDSFGTVPEYAREPLLSESSQ